MVVQTDMIEHSSVVGKIQLSTLREIGYMSTKNLIFIRHAKSSWDIAELSDHERPLGAIGFRDVPIMAENNLELLRSVQHYYCSAAERAKQTLGLILSCCDFSEELASFHHELYTFNSIDVEQFIFELPDEFDTIALVGHNPAFADTINSLTQDYIRKFATAAFCQIEFPCESWQKITPGSGELVHLAKPKDYR